MSHERNPHYIHHQSNTPSSAIIREVVFGLEDGLVSTMGALTGIAAAAISNRLMVLLSGFVIIAVESISMAVGSYLSNKSEREIDRRKLYEEKMELKEFPEEEQAELVGMYIKDGWPKELAASMAEAASRNKKLFLQEMAYRELKIIPEDLGLPFKNALAMGVSYFFGGTIPLVPYLVLTNVSLAIFFSIGITLIGLFVLGVGTTKYSRRSWWRAGLEMLALASAAALIGYLVGQAVEHFI